MSLRFSVALSALVLAGAAQANVYGWLFDGSAYNSYYTASQSDTWGLDVGAYSTGYGYYGTQWIAEADDNADLYWIGDLNKALDFSESIDFASDSYYYVKPTNSIDFSFSVDVPTLLTWDYTQSAAFAMDSILVVDGTSTDVTGLLINSTGLDVSGSVMLSAGSHDLELNASAFGNGASLFDWSSMHVTLVAPSASVPAPAAWLPIVVSGLVAARRRRKRR